jgi:hypothetical protein
VFRKDEAVDYPYETKYIMAAKYPDNQNGYMKACP